MTCILVRTCIIVSIFSFYLDGFLFMFFVYFSARACSLCLKVLGKIIKRRIKKIFYFILSYMLYVAIVL
jgi:hypothetical protein